MAVTRWFAGIGALANFWHGTTIVGEDTEDTYFLGFNAQTDSSLKLTSFKIYGSVYALDVGEIELFCHPAVSRIIKFEDIPTITFLIPKTPIYPVIQAEAANTVVVAFGRFTRLPKSGRTRKNYEVLQEVDGNSFLLSVHMKTPDTARWVLEHQIDDTNLIIQPMHQAVPAVADQLNVVSTSALDTVAGTGAQKVIFVYYDTNYDKYTSDEISLNGLTPVNLIALGYTDVWLISYTYVSQSGSLGKNQGNLFFQDDA